VVEIKDLGGNKYNWVYGLDHTAFTAIGKEHPSPNGGIDSLSEEVPNRWVITHKQDDGSVKSKPAASPARFEKSPDANGKSNS
jgi:hypothetical protein